MKVAKSHHEGGKDVGYKGGQFKCYKGSNGKSYKGCNEHLSYRGNENWT